jgi:hypothetical protein
MNAGIYKSNSIAREAYGSRSESTLRQPPAYDPEGAVVGVGTNSVSAADREVLKMAKF